MVSEINMAELRQDAEHIFNHGFACSESVIYTIRKHFKLDLPDDVIAMGSGFPWGLGRAYCICGALAGGTMCLGLFFGRRVPGDPAIQKCFSVSKELHDSFEKQNGAACCGKLLKDFDKYGGSHKVHCTKIVGETAEKTAEIIARELDIKII